MSRIEDPLPLAVADLEEMARKYETRAGACREAASALRAALGLSTLGPIVHEARPLLSPQASRIQTIKRARAAAPAPKKSVEPVRTTVAKPAAAAVSPAVVDTPARRVGRPPKAKAPAAAKAVDSESAAAAGRAGELIRSLLERIPAALADGERRTSGQLRAAVGGVDLTPFRAALNQLVGGRKVKRHAGTPTDTFGLFTAEELAALPVVKSIPVPTGSVDVHVLKQKVEQILASGATYDIDDLQRNCRGTFPAVQRAEIAHVCAELVQAGAVRIIPLGSRTRYQLAPAAPKEAVAS
jgi:hypothetical protein